MRDLLDMDQTQFDTVLRNAARQTTRRAALGALLSGAVLLTDRGEVDASRKAERRKRRKRRERRGNSDSFSVSDVQVTYKNLSPRNLNFSSGTFGFPSCCRYGREGVLAAGQSFTPGIPEFFEDPWMWLDDGKYWFEFVIPLAYGPIARMAVNGRFRPTNNCCNVIPFGQTVHHRFTLPGANQTREINIAGKIFTFERYPSDRSIVGINLYIPADI